MSVEKEKILRTILTEVHDLYSGQIQRISIKELTPIVFFRDYVSQNRPLIIQGAIEDWKETEKWKENSYLKERMSSSLVHVSVTPNGRADAPFVFERKREEREREQERNERERGEREGGEGGEDRGGEEEREREGEREREKGEKEERERGKGREIERDEREREKRKETCFAKPWEVSVPFDSFITRMEKDEKQLAKNKKRKDKGEERKERKEDKEEEEEEEKCIVYLSHQNDSLRMECQPLLQDIPFGGGLLGQLGNQTFGLEPDAINLWIGNERAVSSCHKDFYENLYAVVRGCKRFYLLPPSSISLLEEKELPPACFIPTGEGLDPLQCKKNDLSLKLEEGDLVPWITKDPSISQEREEEESCPITKICCEVNEGECLFLPSLWYHQVEQKGLTIAVNFWYDMSFDMRYLLYRTVRLLNGNDKE